MKNATIFRINNYNGNSISNYDIYINHIRASTVLPIWNLKRVYIRLIEEIYEK